MYSLVTLEGKKAKQLEAGYYFEALYKALEELGYRVEAEDNSCDFFAPVKEENLETDFFNEEKKEVVEEKKEMKTGVFGEEIEKKVDKKPPFTGKALEIFNLLSKEPHSLQQIVDKTGVAISTAKVVVTYHFKKAGYLVYTGADPSLGIIYSLNRIY